MSYQVIKQPDGRLCIWSTVSGHLEVFDAHPYEIVNFFADEAVKEAVESATKTIDAVLADNPQSVYHQFTMTYGEVAEDHEAARNEYYGEIKN